MIGIGGSGMCPIAELLLSRGYTVTGSDRNENANVKRLKSLGVTIYHEHTKSNINGADLVAFSAAVPDTNPEMAAADELGVPRMERSELLGAITRCYDNVIGVSGTHGKTTVSSMITHILILNKREPNAVIGGRLPLVNSNGVVGSSETLVCEACEFVDTFLQMSPDVSVLLNVDNDHLDYFKTMDNLVNSFSKFVGMSKKAFVNGDDELAVKAATATNADIITFGFDKKNNYYAENITNGKFGFCFDVMKNGEKIGHLDMHIPGKHNILNGLAAFSVCNDMGVEAEGIAKAVETFTGAGRRFEFLGKMQGFTLADDYAHHPTEIKATLSAAKELDYNNVIAVFQPFTFSRTALLKDEFIEALSLAAKVVLTPIMGSREQNTYGIYSEDIAAKLKDAVVVDGFENIADKVVEIAGEGDLVITMGGGDIYKAAQILCKRFEKE
jgi:UDP-N-acetylmuramate--alanine ligase